MLCGVFGKDSVDKPLTLSEYSKLVRWLVHKKMRPANLLQQGSVPTAARGTGIDEQRLRSLLGRGVQLGFAVEEWQRSGIWIISRSDHDYPARYKTHLKDKAPPLLFGVGERSHLTGGGLGIVGSRNIDQAGETFTIEVAKICAANKMPVISGGARGVDQISMRSALEAGGVVFGVLTDSLLKSSVERTARKAIADGRLLLLSPYHPNARFTVGTAMARNKLIYALADYTLVVSAEYKKGGTWAGAEEELKREKKLPVFVRIGESMSAGNSKLFDMGAIAWPNSLERESLREQLDRLASKYKPVRPADEITLFNYQFDRKEVISASASHKSRVLQVQERTEIAEAPATIYQAVLPIILDKLNTPLTIGELAQMLEVNKTQLNAWLKQSVIDKKVRKLTRPVRYQRIK